MNMPVREKDDIFCTFYYNEFVSGDDSQEEATLMLFIFAGIIGLVVGRLI
jgi:hypothetical protein